MKLRRLKRIILRERLSTILLSIALILGLILLTVIAVDAQSASFTYQGKLNSSNNPANGTYEMQFKLFDAITDGNQIGSTITNSSVAVTQGIFTVTLNYGISAFDGSARYLEIGVRQQGDTNPYTVLNPRQLLTATPYAVRSLNATSADTATTATNSTQLGGINANQYVQTSDSRLSDARPPTAGSSNYIQNSNNQQAASNFNISGNGSANTFNAATQYNIGGTRILSIAGASNTFVGSGTGASNTTGNSNTFVGDQTGGSNNTGNRNSFFGVSAGSSNSTGSSNAFFGALTGALNTTGNNNSFFGDGAGFRNTASNNSFFGTNAGQSNTTGTSNSFFGYGSGAANTTANENTFFGHQSGQVNTVCCNSFFGTNAGAVNTTGTANSFFGYSSGLANTAGFSNSFFGYQTGLANTTAGNNSYFGYRAGVIATGANNSFFGSLAGRNNTTGNSNAFFGTQAGLENTTGSFNSFFGYNAGAANTTAINNSFFGQGAGFKNTTGRDNTFIGNSSGLNTTTASNNTFVGSLAGESNTTGINNAFFGFNAGNANNGGGANTFLGVNAGLANVGSSNNTFVGANAGNTNLTGNGNTYVGANSDGGFLITNSVAIGQKAYVGQSDSVVLGSINGVNGATADTTVGIGTSTPATKLHIKDNQLPSLTIESSSTQGAGFELKSTRSGSTALWRIYNDGSSLRFYNQNASPNGEVLSLVTGGGSTDNGSAFVYGDLYTTGLINVDRLGTGGTTSMCWHPSGFISNCSSSLRYKKDMSPFTPGLSLLNKLNPITFRWKIDNKLDLGFGAEDVAKVEPLLVTYNDKGEVEGVKYDRISAVLVNAVKEQQEQIKEQQNQIEKLQQQITNLMKLVSVKQTQTARAQKPRARRAYIQRKRK